MPVNNPESRANINDGKEICLAECDRDNCPRGGLRAAIKPLNNSSLNSK